MRLAYHQNILKHHKKGRSEEEWKRICQLTRDLWECLTIAEFDLQYFAISQAISRHWRLCSRNLVKVAKKIKRAIEYQNDEFKKISEFNSLKDSLCYITQNDGFFAGVVKEISKFALDLVHKQYLLYLEWQQKQQAGWDCTQTFRSTHGLPCSQEMCRHDARDRVLSIEDFDKRWWVHDPEKPITDNIKTDESLH